MKLYYTIYYDGDGYPQLYQIADNPNKLSERISDACSDREYTPDIYVYDTDSKDPLESDEESQLTLYKKHKKEYKKLSDPFTKLTAINIK